MKEMNGDIPCGVPAELLQDDTDIDSITGGQSDTLKYALDAGRLEANTEAMPSPSPVRCCSVKEQVLCGPLDTPRLPPSPTPCHAPHPPTLAAGPTPPSNSSRSPSLPLLLDILSFFKERSGKSTVPLALANVSPFVRVLCECRTAAGYCWGSLSIRRSPKVDGAVVVVAPGEAELRRVAWWLNREMKEEELDFYYCKRSWDSEWEGNAPLGGYASRCASVAGSSFTAAATVGMRGVSGVESVGASTTATGPFASTRLSRGALQTSPNHHIVGEAEGAAGASGFAVQHFADGFLEEQEDEAWGERNPDVLFEGDTIDDPILPKSSWGGQHPSGGCEDGRPLNSGVPPRSSSGPPALISPCTARRLRRLRTREAYPSRIVHIVCVGHQRAKAMLAAASLSMMRSLSISKIELSVDYLPLNQLGSIWDRYTQLSKLELIATNCLGPRCQAAYRTDHRHRDEEFLTRLEKSRYPHYETSRERHFLVGNGGALRGLEHLPLLRELDLTSSLVDGVGFMGRSLTLQKLNLSSTSISNSGLIGLQESASLRTLILFQCPSVSSVKCLTPLYAGGGMDGSGGSDHSSGGSLAGSRSSSGGYGNHELPLPPMNLEMLDLRGTSVNSSGMVGLGLLPRLRCIRLGRSKVTHLDALAGAPLLTHIDLENCTTLHPEEGLQGVECTPVSHLNITRSNAGSLEPLASSRTLQCLVASRVGSLVGRLRDMLFADEFGGSCLWALQHLDLSHSPIDVSGAHFLSMCVNLQYINLSRTTSMTSVEGLEKLPRLREMHVAHTAIQDVNCLGRAPALERLNAAHTHLEDEGIAGLSAAQHLEQLDLTDNQVNRVGHLHACPRLRVLILTSTLVSSHGLCGLEKSQALEELYLDETLVKHFTTWDVHRSLIFPLSAVNERCHTQEDKPKPAASVTALQPHRRTTAPFSTGLKGAPSLPVEAPGVADVQREAELQRLWDRVERLGGKVMGAVLEQLEADVADADGVPKESRPRGANDLAHCLRGLAKEDYRLTIRKVLAKMPELSEEILACLLGPGHGHCRSGEGGGRKERETLVAAEVEEEERPIFYPSLWKLSVAHTRHRSSGLLGILQLPRLTEVDITDTWIDTPLGALFPFSFAASECLAMVKTKRAQEENADKGAKNVLQITLSESRTPVSQWTPQQRVLLEWNTYANGPYIISFLHQRMSSLILQDAKLQQTSFLCGLEYAVHMQYLSLQSCQPSLSHMGGRSLMSVAVCPSLTSLNLADTDLTNEDLLCFQLPAIEEKGEGEKGSEENTNGAPAFQPGKPYRHTKTSAVRQQKQQKEEAVAALLGGPGRAAAYYRQQRRLCFHLRRKDSRLVTLLLSGTIISDLSFLRWHCSLRELHLCATIVKDLSPLETCTALEYLDVAKTRVLDLSPLIHCKDLRFLFAAETFAMQSSTRFLSTMGNLEVLDLSGTPITSIMDFRSLPQLRHLRIRNTAVPRAESKCFPPHIVIQQ